MTIAKRLILLLAVPLLALTGLGVFTRWQLTTIETRSRFVAELQVPSLATLGNISRILADLRVQLRSHVLAASEAERASVRSTFERDDAELDRLLDQYERNLVSEDRDRRLLKDYRGQYRDWLDRAKQIMSLADAGRREEAGEMLRETSTSELGERLNSSAVEWIRLNEDLADSASRTVVESLTGSRRRILVANFVAILLTGLLGFLTFLQLVKPIQALDASVRAIAAGEYDKEVPFTRATDETGGLARSVDVLKQGAAGDGRTALGEGERVTRDGRAAGRLVADGVRPAPPVGPGADAWRRRGRILCARRGPFRAAARRDVRPGGSCRPARRSSGSARASSASARRNVERSRCRISRPATCASLPASARRRPRRRRPCRRCPRIRCSACSKWHRSGRPPARDRRCSTSCCRSSA